MAFSILAGVLVTIQLGSVIIGGAFIDFKFYAHFKMDVFSSVAGFFSKESIILILFFLLFTVAFYYLINKDTRIQRIRRLYLYLILPLLVAGMSVRNGIVRNLVDISEMHLAGERAFTDALERLDYDGFVSRDSVVATPGKNIIVIAMESIEAGYLQDEFRDVTPKLRKLKEEMNYYPLQQHEGGDYTIAALYTWLTGVPMFFKQHGNNVFFNTKSFTLTSIVDALTKAGYHSEYLLGNSDFAGTDEMLEMMGFKVKSEKDYDQKYSTEHWGLHDKDLFDIVEIQLDSLYESEQPFAYFISTISTHGPDGVFDSRMAKVIPEQKSQLEMMAAALDMHIGKLVDRLKEEGRLDNTSIYIIPDHLLYYLGCRVLNDFREPRGLFVITNSNPNSFDPGTTILQMDIPGLLLEGAGVDHNLTFLSDHINGDKVEYLKDNRKAILQLNESALVRDLNIEEEQNKSKKILHPDTVYINANAWSKDNYSTRSVVYTGRKEHKVKRGINVLVYRNNEYQLENYDTWENKEETGRLQRRLKELVENKLCFYVFVHDSAGDIYKNGGNKFKEVGMPELSKLKNRTAYMAYSNHGITSEHTHHKKTEIKSSFVPYHSNRSMTTILDEARDPFRFIAHAGGEIDGHTYTNCLEAMDLAYEKGFRLFELDIIKTSDGQYVAGHDWEKWRYLTKYAGDIPVNLATFRKYKKLEQYTSMDMPMINQWFEN
ncbi:MAG: sulfatase-like hydrolase/transferase, partial [Bacteroidia bacterium]|nr:sulfatase-like hydrolase/transferase [Bacteroidia bacterium]